MRLGEASSVQGAGGWGLKVLWTGDRGPAGDMTCRLGRFFFCPTLGCEVVNNR